ncbi:TonB-dependent receptor plug domain-containing protein [Chryseobacterium sp. SIMBA_029]|uniref:TonB-dependent receptor plug domain-containing protein n=1 Tax=Chryseobacterium sp. SIMBA_029 TaxID=3085772 RepID=UPI00397B8E27
MKLDFPKKGYGAGDEVLADFSMKSLANLPIPFYEAEFTVMHNGEIISVGKLLTDKDGKVQLKFKLPVVLKSSDALLNIKVNFDGFAESISRNIPIVLNNLDVQFMPEGGTLINGTEQNIAFKILDEFEKPVDAVLEIFNQNHQKIKEVTAYNFGMGSFTFIPEKGNSYYAKVKKPENISTTYDFPKAKDAGIILNFIKHDEKIECTLWSTEDREIIMKGSFRDKEIFSKIILLKKGINRLEIPETELPIGICRFTVFDDQIPLAERIIFTNEHKQLNIKITPSKKQYLPREKVILEVETLDENNKPVPANLAVSAVDDKLWTYADDKQSHIISWLLMDSELRGKIEKPQFYFDRKEEKASKSLDLLMLTNGYRYFELTPEVIKNKKYTFLPEKMNPIYGIVEDENKKPVKAEVFLTEEGYDKRKIIKQTTTDNGLFYFTDLDRNVSYKIIAKSFQPKHTVNIRMLSYKLHINPLEPQKLKNVDVEEIIKEASIKEKPNNKPSIENQLKKTGKIRSDTIGSSSIEEVVMIGYGEVKKQNEASSVGLVRKSEFTDKNVASVLNGKVAGISVMASNGDPGSITTIRIRGTTSISNKTPLFIVDGIPVENFNTLIDPNDIKSMTVLKDAAATAVYGSAAANGVIIISSLDSKTSSLKFDITPKSYFAVQAVPYDSLVAYAYNREFFYPVYKTTNTSYRYDYREALYWNPVVETGKNGKASLEFYNSDANSTVRIITEGIAATGLPGRDETTYAAQSLVSIDAKIPQYLTRTDQLTIPVVVKNNSAETRKLVMDVIVPNRMRLIKFDSVITLKPLESGRLWVKLQSDDVVSSNIQFTIRSGDFRETMILPFKVEEKGFPHHYAIINNKTEHTKISIPAFINGSFSSFYYVFEHTALQMFEDIENLKKEPYGCFEQLSSTVYPNVFILDYLKSVKKINSQTESIAIRNMKKGYQKMLSYKNKDGGFGYFNSSESDAALSAFALLEFRDLKKYVAIEPKIIQDLTTFILSKKNKNGLFEVRRSYEINAPYSEYAWSRNMYILYTLSKIGIKNDLIDSYKLALNRSLATKDSYQLALMANTAFYLGKNEDYDLLKSMLDDQYENKNVNPKITFTGSGGYSARAETLSLYMMALQKSSKDTQSKTTKVADELMGYNGYYGFGSTQATSLALETLSEFFAKNEKVYGTDKPKIKINGAEVHPESSFSSAYKVGDNNIEVTYSTEKGLPYKLDYQYYTLEAPKSTSEILKMTTQLQSAISKVGNTNRMTVTVENTINTQLPMTVAKIGIPAGLTLQNALLKDLIDKKQVSYYEIFDNYLVLYWEHMDANEKKVINLDLKVEFSGEYTGKSSNVYLYYMPEAKFWNSGITAQIEP